MHDLELAQRELGRQQRETLGGAIEVDPQALDRGKRDLAMVEGEAKMAAGAVAHAHHVIVDPHARQQPV